MRRNPPTVATAPRGTLVKKIPCQEWVSARIPPGITPALKPKAAMELKMHRALLSYL